MRLRQYRTNGNTYNVNFFVRDGRRVIRRLLTDSPRFLRPGGHLLFEIGFNQHEAVAALIDRNVWAVLDIHRDLQGIPRTVALRRVG